MQNEYPVEEVALADIFLDRDTQVRASVDEETIRRYFEIMVDETARDKFPPVLFFRDENGKLWLADGHHRIMAAIRRKFASILAVIRPGTKEDAIWEAIKANGQNGLPLGRADIRRAVIMVLTAFPNKSTTSIAEAVGCTQQYVSKIKGQVTTSCNLTDGEHVKVEGKDGKTYAARRKRKPVQTSTEQSSTEKTEESVQKPISEEAPETSHETAGPDVSVEETVEPETAESSTADDRRRIDLNVKQTQIETTISLLEGQLYEWLEIAQPQEDRDCRQDIAKRLHALADDFMTDVIS